MKKPTTKAVNEETWHKGCQRRNMPQRLSMKKPVTKAVNEETHHLDVQPRNPPRVSTKKPATKFSKSDLYNELFMRELLRLKGQ